MKEEFISLKTAKLVKEKRFNIYVNSYYIEYIKTQKSDNPSFKMKKGEVEIDSNYFANGDNTTGDFSCDNYICYARPTQALLQRWLREVHNINVISYPSAVFNKKYIYLLLSDLELIEEGDIKYDSYEQALEAGLYKALLLI